MPNIVLIGSECSGKTSLAEALAGYFDIDFLHEYSRQYAESKESELSYKDVMPIAKGQLKSEKDFIKNTKSRLLIFDTCLLSTYIYSKIYYKKVPEKLKYWLDLNLYDHFYLTFPDPEWKEDGIRKMPMSRLKMHEFFLSELVRFKVSYSELRGDLQSRKEIVIGDLKQYYSAKF
ncbi:ATP-binding protein [Hyphobacterium sp. CCMP332]|nr:ATP-binding protein [Hyphobacterium sp. CCMP332]